MDDDHRAHHTMSELFLKNNFELDDEDQWYERAQLSVNIEHLFSDLYSESLIYAMEDFAISRGSACSSIMMNRRMF